jgi:hypothetical protein
LWSRSGHGRDGWRRYHTWLAKHSPAGFPDEVLVRPPRLVFAELKAEAGRLKPDHESDLEMLRRHERDLDELLARNRSTNPADWVIREDDDRVE